MNFSIGEITQMLEAAGDKQRIMSGDCVDAAETIFRLEAERDALRKKLDAVTIILRREPISYGAMSQIRAIMEAEV